LSSIESVDWIVIFDSADCSELIQKLKPQMVVKGGMSKGSKLREQAAVDSVGAEIHFLPKY